MWEAGPIVDEQILEYAKDCIGNETSEVKNALSIRVTQLRREIGGTEKPSIGIIFPSEDGADLCGVVISDDNGDFSFFSEIRSHRFERLNEFATQQLDLAPAALGFDKFGESVMIFDMESTVFESAAVIATYGREHAILAFAKRTTDSGNTITTFAIFSEERVLNMTNDWELLAA